MKNNKMYVLVRRDLSSQQQAVQAGHALAEYLLKETQIPWDNGTLIYLGVRDEQELEKWAYKLTMRGKTWRGFTEPDRNNELTAIAIIDNGEFFKNLRLL